MPLNVYQHGEQLIEDHTHGHQLIKTLKREHGTHCAGYLIALLEDDDTPWTANQLLQYFSLSTLVRATHRLRVDMIVVDAAFVEKLEHQCFWKLTRLQMYRIHTQLLGLYPVRFAFLTRWMNEGL